MKPKKGTTMQSNTIDKYTALTGGVEEVAAGTAEPSLTSIMNAIHALGTTLESKIDKVSIEMTLLRADLNKTSEKATHNATSITELLTVTKALEERIHQLTHQQRQTAARLEDQEGRARRNNIRVVGVPEKMEGPSTDLFLEDLILNHLKPKRLSKFFTIERAHRAPGPLPRPGAAPRTIIARILNYRDRDAILQAAHIHGDLHIDNTHIRLFPDFTLKVQQERRRFDNVKRMLRDRGVKYMMFFPARLKVILNGKSFFFTSPEEAHTWLEEHGGQPDSPRERGSWRHAEKHSPSSSTGPADRGDQLQDRLRSHSRSRSRSLSAS